MTSEWASINSLAGLGPVPQGFRGARKWAHRLGLTVRKGRGNGGKRNEVKIAELPVDVRAALAARSGDPALLEQSFRDRKAPAKQRAEARAALVLEVERLAADGSTRTAAVARVAAERGCSESWVWSLLARSRGLPGPKRPPALADRRPAPPRAEPTWAKPLLRAWRTPTKRSLAEVVAELRQSLGEAGPSYGQAKRHLAGLSSVERARGRLGPNALKGLRAFVRRTVDGLEPGDVFIADGHTFDAEIMHPNGGQPCRPEITSVLDVRTRRWVGWSAALAESTWAVADALRHAVETAGVPAIYYADRGSGQDSQVLGAMLGRLGIVRERSIARNSQARGVIERFNKHLIALSRRLPTYLGADMDADAARVVHLESRRQLRTTGESRLLMPWSHFVEMIEGARQAYNARPHRALGGQSPDAVWQGAMAAGWQPLLLDQAETDDLFRPYALRVTRRGEVSLHGRRYFARHLEHLDGGEVLVGYDIHDASRVWVRDMDERLVAVAGLDANAHPYFPASRIEQARQARAVGRLKRLEARAESVRAELEAPRLVEGPAAGVRGEIEAEMARLERGEIVDQPAWVAAVKGATRRPIPAETVRMPSAGQHKRGQLLWQRRLAGEVLTADENAFLERMLDALIQRESRRNDRRQTKRQAAVAPSRGRPAAAATAPYPVVDFTGTEDDAFFARARWLERRLAAGESLDERERRWLEVAQGEPWYATRARMEGWHQSHKAKAG